MKLSYFACLLLLLTALCAQSQSKTIRTLIVDGQNNHDQWPKLTYMMKQYLEETGKFSVDVKRSRYTWKGDAFIKDLPIAGVDNTESLEKSKTDPYFRPDFSMYDLVVINFGWNAAPWPDETNADFEKFMKNGGGMVVIHAANNSFSEWPAYNQMIGLGGWGDRNEKDGPYVYYDRNDKLVCDTQPGPAENIEILATAFSPKDNKGTDHNEPMLMTIKYGKGRVFHMALGHVDYSVQDVGFITSLQRGGQWAATGKVNIPIPADFPTAESTRSREFVK